MLNDVTEPGLADVDPARSIWLAKPYGNDNLLWLSSQVRLPIPIHFWVHFSGL